MKSTTARRASLESMGHSGYYRFIPIHCLDLADNFRKDAAVPAFRGFALLLLSFLIGACSYVRLPEPHRPDRPRVRDLAPVHRELQAADAASAHVLVTEIGQIQHSGYEAPIWRLVYRPFRPGLKRALLLSGIHGDEMAGIDYILKLVDTLARSPAAGAGWDMDIIPIVNPWGWVHSVPYNPRGVDVGWDFAAFNSAEARLIRRFLREKNYDLVVDLREDPAAAGFYIWQYGLKDDTVSRRIISKLQASGYPIEHGAGAMLIQPSNGIIATPMWGLSLMGRFRQLPLGGYIRQNAASAVFTVETPSVLPLAERSAMQQIAVEALFAEYGAGPSGLGTPQVEQ
jgi:hypothetical protein